MPTTPYLGIEQLSTNQAQKELTINDAIVALEGAGNAALTVDFSAASSITLSDSHFTRNGVFKVTGQTAGCTLVYPKQFNAQDVNRVVTIINKGGFPVTVQANTGTVTPVVVPGGSARLVAMQGSEVTICSQASTASNFVDLPDGPGGFGGAAGKVLTTNEGEDQLVFVDLATLLPAILSLLPTEGRAAGKVLGLDEELNLAWITAATDPGGDPGGGEFDLLVGPDDPLLTSTGGDTLAYGPEV